MDKTEEMVRRIKALDAPVEAAATQMGVPPSVKLENCEGDWGNFDKDPPWSGEWDNSSR